MGTISGPTTVMPRYPGTCLRILKWEWSAVHRLTPSGHKTPYWRAPNLSKLPSQQLLNTGNKKQEAQQAFRFSEFEGLESLERLESRPRLLKHLLWLPTTPSSPVVVGGSPEQREISRHCLVNNGGTSLTGKGPSTSSRRSLWRRSHWRWTRKRRRRKREREGEGRRKVKSCLYRICFLPLRKMRNGWVLGSQPSSWAIKMGNNGH